MKRYLVLAHYDGDKTALKELMQELARQDPESEFYLVVPATPPATQTWTWSEREAYEAAKQRMNSTLSEIQSPGVNLSGGVHQYAVLPAVEEVLKSQSFDQVLVATPPESEARTTFEEIAEQVRLFSDIPLRHVTSQDAKPVERA